MKVLMVNKFHYIKGGSETYYFSLRKKLADEGHIVIDFSMKDERNFESLYSKYFVENVDYSKESSAISKIKMALNIIYSKEAKDKFEALVLKEKPDLVHLHIFQHQISPSILDICKKYNIPTVYTAHDLKMICLNYKMVHHEKICEECKDGHLYHCAFNRCVKESFYKSCINTIEGYIHKWHKSYDIIDYIITPSEFYRKKFEEFGIASERLVHIPNFLGNEDQKVNISADSEKYFLYFGRLSSEKGIFTLIHAMESITSELYIAGEGPLKKDIENYIVHNNINNIRLIGFISGQALVDIIGNAKAVVIPSEWYENGPYSAIEALQLKRPLIGANIGGIPELIDGNGILYGNGTGVNLSEALSKIENCSEEDYYELTYNSYALFRKNYTWERHYKELMNVYLNAIKGRTRWKERSKGH